MLYPNRNYRLPRERYERGPLQPECSKNCGCGCHRGAAASCNSGTPCYCPCHSLKDRMQDLQGQKYYFGRASRGFLN